MTAHLSPEDRDELAVNAAIGDLVRYYVQRRPMGNPKGWDHVLRRFNGALPIYRLTDAEADEVRRVLGVLESAMDPQT